MLENSREVAMGPVETHVRTIKIAKMGPSQNMGPIRERVGPQCKRSPRSCGPLPGSTAPLPDGASREEGSRNPWRVVRRPRPQRLAPCRALIKHLLSFANSGVQARALPIGLGWLGHSRLRHWNGKPSRGAAIRLAIECAPALVKDV